MVIYLSVDLILCPLNSAGIELRKIIKSIRDGTFEYESKEPVTTNWAQYDHAQIYEMVNYPDNIRGPACEADKRIKERTPPRKRGAGRPPTAPVDVAKALLIELDYKDGVLLCCYGCGSSI